MVARRAGNAWLVHSSGQSSRRSWLFASGLAPDPELTVVVVDIPGEAPGDVLREVARAIPPRSSGLRLVFGRTPPGGSAKAAQWLASELGCAVVTPIGRPWPTPDGGLFMTVDRGRGWMRYDPSGHETWEGMRYPSPAWEKDVRRKSWPVTEHTETDLLAAGLWLRPRVASPSAQRHRAFLMSHLYPRPDSITLVIGMPGADPVPLSEIQRLWWTLPEHARTAARLVRFGPVEPLGHRSFTDAITEAIGTPVRFCVGLPVGAPHQTTDEHAHLFLHEDGSPGRLLMTREVIQLPPQRGREPELLVAEHRWPLDQYTMLRPGVYQYAPDVVAEVVSSGLWLRGTHEPAHARGVRAAPAREQHEVLLCDESDTGVSLTLRQIAADIVRAVPADCPVRIEPVGGHPAGAENPGSTPVIDVTDGNQAPAAQVRNGHADSSQGTGKEGAAAWPHLASAGEHQKSVSFTRDLLQRQPALLGDMPFDETAHALAVLRTALALGGFPAAAADLREAGLWASMDSALAACLRRLPPFIGPVTLRVSLDDEELAQYARGHTVSTADFLIAAFSGNPGQPGNTDILIASMRGRRTALLGAGDPDLVVFPPGSAFAVIKVTTEGDRNIVFLREVPEPHDAPDRTEEQTLLRQLSQASRDWQRDERSGVLRERRVPFHAPILL
ncbi:hypothetical protein [Streptomyces sp. SCL15-6]|uniref:hypothetical protein n=1 Tax=Streptomyces sp. SCL15-6 TaxID=2967222 RepID=UPI002966B36B|nr:hypothetical protein [Streptomyces sp. SCL15-6]